MSLGTQELQSEPALEPKPPLRTRIPVDVWIIIALLAMFLSTWNGYWVRGGDSDVYLDMGRNLALGRGYIFNHEPVSVVSPLWPLVLAGAMKISASFAFLKLLPVLFMTLGLWLWYRVLLYLTTPAIAAWSVLLAGLLSPVASLTYMFHTESFFMPIAAGSVLVGLQINRHGANWTRIVVLMLLCAASIATRWAGLLWWALIAGALLDGRTIFSLSTFKRSAAIWVIAAATLLVTLVTFVALRRALHVTPEQLDPRFDTTLAVHYDLINDEPDSEAYVRRVTLAGKWVGGLLWEPFTTYGKHLRAAIGGCGLILMLVTLSDLPLILRRRQWLVIALLGYFAVLIVDWPSPVPRYLIPASPLLLAIFGQSAADWNSAFGKLGKWTIEPAIKIVVASLVIVNGISIVVEAAVAHSRDFYGTYEAGLDQSLIDIAKYVREHGAKDGEVAVNRVDANLGRGRFSNGWMRALVVLSDRGIRNVPIELTGIARPDWTVEKAFDPLRDPIFQWLRAEHVKYYLYRPESAIFWHFDLKALPKDKFSEQMDWRLYEVRDSGLVRVIPPRMHNWPTHVPGIGSD